MTILTGSLTSLQLSGSALVQRKDTGAEVLLDLDFTKLPTQTLTDGQYNSIGGISTYVVTNGSPFFKIKNGEGVSYSDDGTGYAFLYYYYYTTFTGSVVNVADRIRAVAEFSGTRADAGPSGDPDYVIIGFGNDVDVQQQQILTCRGPFTNQKFNYLSLWTTDGYSSNTQVSTETGAKTLAAGGFTGSIRLELDGMQGSFYTAADRESSPGGLTNFPQPGDITPQARTRMLTNTGMPKLINTYASPFTGSLSYIIVGFDANQAGTFSGSLQRMTIFRYGAD